MLESFLQTLTQELLFDTVPQKGESGGFLVSLNTETAVEIFPLDSEVLFFGTIGTLPKLKREEFFILLMKANFLGQGTGGAVIGMDPEENLLTLSLLLPYDMNYKMFREALEDFANFLDYWKTELISHKELE